MKAMSISFIQSIESRGQHGLVTLATHDRYLLNIPLRLGMNATVAVPAGQIRYLVVMKLDIGTCRGKAMNWYQ